MSSSWFGKLWRGAGALWSLGTFALFLFSLWFVGSLAVHHFQGAGLNGVYEASDGFGDMTFWPNGTYLFSSMGIQLPGKYQVRNNGTVDMLAQYNSALHPAANARPDAQAASGFMGIFAAGLGDGAVSADRNTFQWQGHAFSYDHEPTTGPPAVPDPNATGTTTPSGAALLSQMHSPTPQEINQTQAKPGDEFHVNTDPDPKITDPNHIGTSPTDQNEWDPSNPKMQQYYRTHPNMAPVGVGQAAPGSPAAPPDAAPNYAPPQGVIMPDNNIQEELKRVK